MKSFLETAKHMEIDINTYEAEDQHLQSFLHFDFTTWLRKMDHYKNLRAIAKQLRDYLLSNNTQH